MLTTSDFSYFEVTSEEIYGGYAYQITRNLLTLPKLFETKLTGWRIMFRRVSAFTVLEVTGGSAIYKGFL